MGHQTRTRAAAVLGSALLLGSLAGATITVAASAASPTCRGEVATIVGTDAGEVIVGTGGADVIVAKGGDDTIRGLGGADVVCAGAGEDRVHGGSGRDELEGGNADDTLLGGKGQDRLRGNAGDDDLDGGLHRDTCFQGSGTGERVACENPFARPTPAPAPTPAPTPTPTPKPTPKPDSDDDGFTDDVDACPAKGASAWGLDGSGCPKPPADSDGDGFTDDVDACPSKGDQGFGVDGTGCPNPPPPTFQSVCREDLGGTYSPGPVTRSTPFEPGGEVTLEPVCDWIESTGPGNQAEALDPFCDGFPPNLTSFGSPPYAWVGCRQIP